MPERPRIGVGIIIVKDGKILMGQRKNSHGSGAWSFPGGHLEFNETIEDCARREILEETGLTVGEIKQLAFTNDIFPAEGKHYVTLFLITNYLGGELKNLEPEKLERWDWFNWKQMPAPLFTPITNLLKQNLNPFS